MDTTKQSLIIEQTDRKLKPFNAAGQVIIPPRGWINTIRNAMKMSLSQMGKRLGITAPSVREIEGRESNGTITLNTLREAGRALNMRLVYGFVPMDRSIRKSINKRAREVASQIVMRSSHNMKLEDQGTTKAQVKKAIKMQADKIITSMPKSLWD
ncbi:MAG: mobile mystery protein A [Bacteroidales bacterium]